MQIKNVMHTCASEMLMLREETNTIHAYMLAAYIHTCIPTYIHTYGSIVLHR